MKKKVLSLFFIVILSLSLASSVEISMRESLKKGENAVIQISGTFIDPLKKEDIRFYRRHMATSMDPYDLRLIEGDYFLYLSVPLEKIPDNYSIVLKDIKYLFAGNRIQGDVSKNFTIKDEQVPFRVSPALIVADSEYQIKLENLMPTLIEIDLEKSEKTLEQINETGESVQSGGFFDILFGVFEENDAMSGLESSAKIYLKSGETKIMTYAKPQSEGFLIMDFFYEGDAYSALVYTPIQTTSSSDTIVGETIENNTIDQVEENKTEEDKSFWDSLNDLFGGDKKNETESVNESEENVDELEDAVEEGIDEPSAEDELIVNETKNSTNESTQSEAELLKACESLGGKVCVVNEETCEGQIKTSKNIKCCIGECVPVKKSSTGKTIGWILIISIALFVTWFLKKKYMKARPQSPNLIDIANKK